MKLILSDKTELEIRSFENITFGPDAGGVQFEISGDLETQYDFIKDRASSVSIMVDDSTVAQFDNMELRKNAYKDLGTGLVTLTIAPISMSDKLVEVEASVNETQLALAEIYETLGSKGE